MADHAEKHYTIPQVALNLFFTCIISAIVISGVYTVTKPIADKNALEAKNKAMKEIVPMAATFEELGEKKGWYIAKDESDKVVGYIVPSESRGFDGEISMIVGVATDGTVIDYSVLAQKETPGLGDPIAGEKFRSQFRGKGIELLEVVKNDPKTPNINALTGATISSKAVTKAVVEGLEAAKAQFDIK